MTVENRWEVSIDRRLNERMDHAAIKWHKRLSSGIAKATVAMGIVLACGVGSRADYLSDRRTAMELIKAGKNEEAMSAFIKMADSTASNVQKSDALELAAMRAQSLKRYDQAMELARCGGPASFVSRDVGQKLL